MKYKIIYADPPWSYDNFQGKGTHYGDVSAHYDTMEYNELLKLPIKELADENCVMFMWATFPNLQQALDLMKEWGFKYKTVAFTWVKLEKKCGKIYSGIGFYTNSNAEICLLGTKGSLKRINKDVKQIIQAPIREHSRKPDETYSRIERLYGDVPKIELFARHKREGWNAWGNQVPKEQQNILTNR